jgi:hypothetical protein
MTGKDDPILTNGGNQPNGQLMRWLPGSENGGAAAMWKAACFAPPLDALNTADFHRLANLDRNRVKFETREVTRGSTKSITVTQFSATVDLKPEFTVTKWVPTPAAGQGLEENKCWPSLIAPLDPYYAGRAPPYQYAQAYDPPRNGA